MNVRSARRSATSSFRQWLRSFIILAVGVAIPPGIYLAAVAGAPVLLAAPAPPLPQRADAIVVLGGDGPIRAAKAAEIWNAGLGNRVIVTGDGDCRQIRDALVGAGVSRNAILIECLSENTWMNALNSRVLLEEVQARTAILVTSWFHTGRAARVFRLICPGIRWFPVATESPPSLLAIVEGPYGDAISYEYLKVIAYRGRELLFSLRHRGSDTRCFGEGSGA